MVGQTHDHDIGVGVVDGFFHRGGRVGNAPSALEGGSPFLAPRVDHLNAVLTPLAMEGRGVKVTYQPGPQHRDAMRSHVFPPDSALCPQQKERCRNLVQSGIGSIMMHSPGHSSADSSASSIK